MSRFIEVSDRAYAALKAAAAAEETTVCKWLDRHLPNVLPADAQEEALDAAQREDCDCGNSEPKSLLDLLKGRIGVVSSGRSDLSERHSELFLEGLLEKRRMGTL